MVSIEIELPPSQFRALEQRARSDRTTVPRLVERALSALMHKRNDFSPAMSPALARKQRKQLERDIAAHHKRENLDKLAKLRRQIADARKSAKPRRAEAVDLCRVGRQMAKDRAKQLRIEGREAIPRRSSKRRSRRAKRATHENRRCATT
jgi:hypothetical protein